MSSEVGRVTCGFYITHHLCNMITHTLFRTSFGGLCVAGKRFFLSSFFVIPSCVPGEGRHRKSEKRKKSQTQNHLYVHQHSVVVGGSVPFVVVGKTIYKLSDF